jgi:hypothetical protein
MLPLKIEHKKQLHEQILVRCSELEATLNALRGDEHLAQSGRARAVEDALSALETHLSGGWDVIGDVEAAALSRWLESTRFLHQPGAAPCSVGAIWARLEARWKLDGAKVPKPASAS